MVRIYIHKMLRYISASHQLGQFAGTQMDVPLDGSITKAAYRGYTQSR
jgi:hypothetical protein